MDKLSYSAHLSNGDHAINSKAKLSGVAKHNLRKYHSKDYNKENIVVLCGTDKLMEDVKKVYKEQFDESVKKYNQKQTRDDRKIDDYFEKVCNSKNKDIAVELIFQLGDKDYWDRNEEKKKNMDVAFEQILKELQKQAPDLVVANAVVHRDEASPHMHVVAVPVGRGFKNGMETQVSKRKVCTKEFLEDVLQGSMRKFVSANLFTWISELNLKRKEFGRNHDLSVAEYKVKAETERAEKLAKENAESEKELNETIAKQIVAEKELKDTYKELEVVGDVADLGKNIKKLEKVVIPFIDKLYGVFRNVVDFAKGCFAQLKEVTEKYHEVSEINESLRRQNSNLREQIEDQEKEIDELYDSKEKLGYFETFLRKEDYDKVIEMGEEQDKIRTRSR